MAHQIYFLPIIILVFICEQTWQYKLVCYFSNQSQYELITDHRFFAEDIPACRCTHIHFGYAQINNADLAPTEFNDDTPGGSYNELVDMKSINPRMKVLLSVGGPEQSSELFLDMLSSRDSILQFATNVVEYLRKYGFDGIDIAWEFPGNSLPSPDLYTQLIRELRTAFNAEADAQGNDRLLLAVTLASTKGTIDASYDIPSIEPYIDYANILSYNYHNHCQNVTGLNAPLYSSQEERIMGRGAEQLNQNWTVNYFIDLGLPPDKINLGIPTFGLKFSLEHVANKGVGSPTNIPLNCLPDDDRVPYYQTCDGLSARDQSRRWVDAYDNEQEAPYASYGKEWITYESTRSIQQKAEFIVDNSLGGAMVWSLDRDDFSNSCGEGNFPLLNTLQETLGPTAQLCVTPSTPGTTPQRTALSQETTMKTTSAFKTTTQPLITTTPTTATAPTRASTVSQDFDQLCQNPGQRLPVNTDCRKFVQCIFTSPGTYIPFMQDCPEQTYFSIDTSQCENISEVRDCPGYIAPITTTSVTPVTTSTQTKDLSPSSTTRPSSTTTTTSLVTTVTTAPVRNSTEVQDFDQLCQNPGQRLPVNTDCRKFVQCIFTSPGTYIPFMQDCPEQTYFSIDTSQCENISEVRDCPGYIVPVTTTSMTPVTTTQSTSTDTSKPNIATTLVTTDTLTTATTTATVDKTSQLASTSSHVTTDIPVSTTPDPCAQTNYRMVCYVTKRDYFPPLYYPDIDVNLCTHLIYAFASLNENTISVETTADTQVYHEVLALRSQNPNLKVLLSIGGWNHLQAPFNDLVSSDTNIDEFAQSAIGFLRNETFDGLDLAWLFPSASQVPSIQTKFTALLEALYKAFSEEAMSIPTSRLLLTVATGAKKEVIDGSYIIPELQRYADFVNVLAFDYHLRCADRTGMNAPLYAGTGELTQLNQNWTVNYYLNNGLSRGKLVMGIPVYGRQFRLANQMNNGPGQLTTGVESTCRRNSGITPYFLICNALSGYQTAWDNVRRVPFAYNTKLVWLTYDNERSVREKANFIKREDLGGAVVWSLNEEDFSGSCGAQAYPLVNTIRCTLSQSGSSSSTTTKSTGTTTKFTGSTTKFTGSTTKSTGTTTKFTGSTTKFTGSTTKSTGTTTKFTGSTLPTTPVVCNGPPRNANEPQNFTQLCTNNTDLLPYNPDCTRFVQCEPDGWVIKNCSACLYFNRGNSVCDFPENVMDCTRQTTKSTGSTTKSTGTTPKFTGSTTKSTGPTTEYTGSTTKSTGTTTKFTGSTTKSTGTTAKFTGSTTKFTGSTTKSTGTTTKFTGSTTKFTGSTTKSTGSTTKFTGSTLPTTPVVCNGPPRNANEPQNFTQLCINNTDLLPYNPDCTRFVQCEPDGWVIKNCSACLYFNPENSVCDFPENVMDCTRQTTKSTGSTTKSTGTTPKFTGSTTKFTGPTTEYTGSTTKSTGITTKFTGSTTKSTGTTAKFTGSTTKFTGSTTKSTGTTTKFTGSTTKFTGSTTKSTGSTTKFTGSTLPTTPVVCNGPPRNANEPQNFTQLCTNNTDLLPYNPDCTRFVQCEPDGWVIKNCSACLYFNPGNSVCDFPENVMDCMRQTTKSTGSTTKSTGTTTKFTGSTTKSTGTTAKFTGSTTKFTGSTTKSTGTTTKFTGSTTKFTGSTTKSADSTTKFTGSTLPTTSVVCNGPPRNTNEPQNFTQLCANNTDLLPYNPDCTRFVQCEPDGWVIKNCSACLYFNPGNSVCDFPENVIDCTRQTTKSTGSTTKSTGTTTKFTGSTTKSTGPTTEYTGSTTKSTGTTTKFTGSTTKSTGTTTKFTGSTTKSTGTTPKFTGSTTKSTGPTTEYTGSTTKSTGTTTKFTGSTTKSTGTTAKFTGTTTKFTGSTTKSTGTTTKFTGSTTKSTGTTTKFTGSSTKSTTPSTASTSQKPCYSPQRSRNSQDVQNFDEMCFHNKLIQYNPDCRRYVHCEYSSWSIMTCPDCLYFSSQSNVCEYPEDVPDCQDPIPVITTTTASPSTAKKCTAPAKPRASTQSQDFVTLCRLAGDNAHLPLNTDCGSFVQCTFSNIGIYHVKRCPECQYFHIDSSRCELPGVVTDCQSAASVDITAPLKAPSTPDQCDLDGSFGHARRGFRLVQNFHALCLVDGQVIPVYNDCSCYVMCKGAGVWTLAVCPNGQFYDTNGKCIPQDQVTLCN